MPATALSLGGACAANTPPHQLPCRYHQLPCRYHVNCNIWVLGVNLHNGPQASYEATLLDDDAPAHDWALLPSKPIVTSVDRVTDTGPLLLAEPPSGRKSDAQTTPDCQYASSRFALPAMPPTIHSGSMPPNGNMPPEQCITQHQAKSVDCSRGPP